MGIGLPHIIILGDDRNAIHTVCLRGSGLYSYISAYQGRSQYPQQKDRLEAREASYSDVHKSSGHLIFHVLASDP